MNLCIICNVNDKYISPKGQKSSYCRTCNSKKVTEYYKTEKGKENLRKYQQKYYKTEKGKDVLKRSQEKYYSTEKGKQSRRKSIRNYTRKKNGFTIELFNKLLVEQEYCCAICSKDIHESSHADHNHNTGASRGILCPGCNTLLGRIESVGFEWVEKAKEYLKKYD